jgi:O-glycosyl hydrolase
MARRLARGGRVLCSVLALLTILGLVLEPVAMAQFFPEREPTNDEIRFGCEPGPVEELEHADPPLPAEPVASPLELPRSARLVVTTGRGRAVSGSGFNLEHTLWSCPPFRRIFRRSILEPFQPEVARVDTGQLPFAPNGLWAHQLHWDVYQRMMDDPKYQPSWEMLRRLNRADVKIMLGVWGLPGAFTDDGTRRGRLFPWFVDKYVEYYTAVVDYLVHRQGIRVWSATVMNEPDGGDGTLIDPDDFMAVTRKLGPSLARYGVTLYGPDTASAANALPYVRRILDDRQALSHFGAIATHEYFTDHALDQLVQMVRDGGSDLPVYVTEYTSFRFGAMDRGQEATNQVGQMLESLQVFASVMNAGADAALYWDAVDYYQAGHAAITRWGLLQGPAEAFEPRKRYYGFLQILPYLQPGSEVLATSLRGPDETAALAVAGGPNRPGELMIAVINRSGPLDLSIELSGPAADEFQVYVTDPDRDNDHVGRLRVRGGRATLYVPARSVTTLTSSPAPDDEE